ncbi:MAG: sigma-70 family RNA polymerase sigma factor [Chloroflexi bacterium]|nr:sigma-70 family RNA polymerase sigma factor [Chloroflexota bacterium]
MTVVASLVAARHVTSIAIAIRRQARDDGGASQRPTVEGGVIVSPMALELVDRARGGDVEAFSTLARGVGDRLFAIAFTILGDRASAEDVVQQALLHIWRNLPSLREPERFDGWSYRIVVNAAHAEIRRLRHWTIVSSEVSPVATSRDHASGIVARDEVERAMRRLSPDHRTVLVLKHVADLPNDEIAALLGVPEGTVRSRLHHAQGQLRAAIAADSRPSVPGGVP